MKSLKQIGSILFLLAVVSSAAQQQAIPEYTPERKFADDLKSNNLSIYIIGGIISAIGRDDLAFARQYGVTFHDFGCVVPANLNYYTKYNHLVFDYLSKQYGDAWQQQINQRVLGWKSWKNK